MTDPERDAELEMWLRRSSSLHDDLARLDRTEPPDELDRVVLDRARDAIRIPRSVVPLRMRWALPVGLAATLIVAFTLLLQVGPTTVSGPPTPAAVKENRSADDAASLQRYEDAAKDESVAETSALSRPIEIAPATRATQPPSRAAGPERARSVLQVVPNAQKADRAALSGATDDVERKDADLWLAEIEQLRAQGLVAEAERELAEFKRAYPERSDVPAATPGVEDR